MSSETPAASSLDPEEAPAQSLLEVVDQEPSAADPQASEAVPVATSDPDTHRFECRSCGYVYDPAEGVRKLAIESGTPFSALDPASFRCPVCRSPVAAFKDIGPRDKPKIGRAHV